MMKPRPFDGLADVHLEIDDIQNHLKDGGDDARPPGGAEDQQRSAVPDNDGGRHRRERPLAGLDGIVLALQKPELIGLPGPCGEVIHLIVDQNQGATVPTSFTYFVRLVPAPEKLKQNIDFGVAQAIGDTMPGVELAARGQFAMGISYQF